MRRIVSQGTVSVLVGCHSVFIHPFLVLISWIRLYGTIPKPWELFCIFIHDIGHIGKNYLDDEVQKNNHWILGARIAERIVGRRGYLLVAGHTRESGLPTSMLLRPDKYSWYIAPAWWMYINTITEPKLKTGLSRREAVRVFRERVKKSIESGEYAETHKFYTERAKIG